MQLLPPIRAVQQGHAHLRCLGAVDKVSKIQEDNWACDVLDSFSADTLKGFDKKRFTSRKRFSTGFVRVAVTLLLPLSRFALFRGCFRNRMWLSM